MKKIDVQNAITKILQSNKLTIIDSLSNRYFISTYEEYMNFFNLIKSAYYDNIKEYVDEANQYINNMENYISNAINDENIESIEQYVQSNLLSSIEFNSYNREKNVMAIYPESFSIQREGSKEAFINIYCELGYEALNLYIDLVKAPSRFSMYLNDDNKQIIAMKYLLFKTDHHSTSKFKRDYSAKTIYQESSNNIQETLRSITKEKDDFINYMDKEKEDYKAWFESTSVNIDDFIRNHNKELANIEKTYEEKLKVEEPAKFMLEQSKKYKWTFVRWTVAIVILSIILIGLMALVIHPQVNFDDKLITVNILSKETPVYSSVILLAIISLVVYILRIFIKMAVSAKHLMEEYKQKYSLTYFYLSLINNGNIQDEKTQNIILTSLFTKADTGLIKNDGSNDADKTILSLLIK